MAHVPEIAVAAEYLFRCGGNRNISSLCVGNRIRSGANIPLAPGSDHPQLRSERFVRQLETYLIVPLAGAAVSDGVRAFSKSDFDLPACQQRSSDGGAEQ